MAVSKTEWQRQVRADGAMMKDEHRRERFRRIAEITKMWRDGFQALKEENDRMQKELKDWHELEELQIRNYVIENLQRGGPF